MLLSVVVVVGAPLKSYGGSAREPARGWLARIDRATTAGADTVLLLLLLLCLLQRCSSNLHYAFKHPSMLF